MVSNGAPAKKNDLVSNRLFQPRKAPLVLSLRPSAELLVFKMDPVAATRVWNGLDQSAGFIIQSSPGGFGLHWIRTSLTQWILDWIVSTNLQSVSHI